MSAPSITCPLCGHQQLLIRREVFGGDTILSRSLLPHQRPTGKKDNRGRAKQEPCSGEATFEDDIAGYLRPYANIVTSGAERTSSGALLDGNRIITDGGDRYAALAQALLVADGFWRRSDETRRRYANARKARAQ